MVRGYVLISVLALLSLIYWVLLSGFNALDLVSKSMIAFENAESIKLSLIEQLKRIHDPSHCHAPNCKWIDYGYEPCLLVKHNSEYWGTHLADIKIIRNNYELTVRYAIEEKGGACIINNHTPKIIKSGILSTYLISST